MRFSVRIVAVGSISSHFVSPHTTFMGGGTTRFLGLEIEPSVAGAEVIQNASRRSAREGGNARVGGMHAREETREARKASLLSRAPLNPALSVTPAPATQAIFRADGLLQQLILC